MSCLKSQLTYDIFSSDRFSDLDNAPLPSSSAITSDAATQEHHFYLEQIKVINNPTTRFLWSES